MKTLPIIYGRKNLGNPYQGLRSPSLWERHPKSLVRIFPAYLFFLVKSSTKSSEEVGKWGRNRTADRLHARTLREHCPKSTEIIPMAWHLVRVFPHICMDGGNHSCGFISQGTWLQPMYIVVAKRIHMKFYLESRVHLDIQQAELVCNVVILKKWSTFSLGNWIFLYPLSLSAWIGSV